MISQTKAAKLLDCSDRTIRRMLADGRLTQPITREQLDQIQTRNARNELASYRALLDAITKEDDDA